MVVGINTSSRRRSLVPLGQRWIAYALGTVLACLAIGAWLFDDAEPVLAIPNDPRLDSGTPRDDGGTFSPTVRTNQPSPRTSDIRSEEDSRSKESVNNRAPFRSNSESNPDRLLVHASSRNLADADMRGETLSNVDYVNADLRGADLSSANISGADFRGANLRDTTWQRAVVNAEFENAELNHADLRGSNFTFSDMRAADLRHVNAGPIEVADNELIAATFDGVDFTGADLRGSVFRLALVVGTVFRDADLRGADLRRVMFVDEAHWEGAIYDETTMFDEEFDPLARGMIRLGTEK